MEDARLRKQVQKAKRWNLIVFGLFAAMAVFAVAALCIYQFQHTYSPENMAFRPGKPLWLCG